VLGADGRLWTFGSATAGVLGHGVGEDGLPAAPAAAGAAVTGVCTSPALVQALLNHHIIHVALSETHAAAVELLPDGHTQVWAWGQNRALGLPSAPAPVNSKAGKGSIDIRSSDAVETGSQLALLPQLIPALSDERVVSVACGLAHTLALTEDGRVFAFGCDREGALGMGDRDARMAPTLIQALSQERIVGIAAGHGSSLFVTADGKLLACGANDRGQAGTNSPKRRYLLPTVVNNGLRDVVSASTSAFHACALNVHGQCWSWGFNQAGQLGVGNRNLEARQPLLVQGALAHHRVKQVSAGFAHTGAVTEDGKLFLFGRGREGQLGRGDQLESIAATRDSPVEVAYFSQRGLRVEQVATGGDFTLALVKEGLEANRTSDQQAQRETAKKTGASIRG
jgi:alpha-tubulin suppressor-like RCC1 family protein